MCFFSSLNFAHCLQAVSYTHLDVYKRQGKEWPIAKCDYFIDIVTPINLTKDVFNPLHLMDNWNKLACAAFIDGENSKIFGRAFYMPELINQVMQRVAPKQWNKVYGLSLIHI